MAVDEKRCMGDARNSAKKRRSRKTNKTLQNMWLGGVREVASCSATQGLWLENRKVECRVVGVNQSRLPGRTVGGVRREER